MSKIDSPYTECAISMAHADALFTMTWNHVTRTMTLKLGLGFWDTRRIERAHNIIDAKTHEVITLREGDKRTMQDFVARVIDSEGNLK